MKTNETVLAEFIKDFNLETPGVGVCFMADIEFLTPSINKIFNCEVHIITMEQKQLSLLYLLHPQLSEYGIPDTFQFDPENFSYENKKNLVINDYDLLRGKYSLSICPIRKVAKKADQKDPGFTNKK